tara:strand:+ start:190 stop:450 length:261 start_codon:yes stop_codon:yes gene_type:complete
MKTIVKNLDNVSKFLVDDNDIIEATTTNITIGNPAKTVVWDLNDESTTVYANVTNAPDDWKGSKYCFDGTNWTSNPNWSAPEDSEE